MRGARRGWGAAWLGLLLPALASAQGFEDPGFDRAFDPEAPAGEGEGPAAEAPPGEEPPSAAPTGEREEPTAEASTGAEAPPAAGGSARPSAGPAGAETAAETGAATLAPEERIELPPDPPAPDPSMERLDEGSVRWLLGLAFLAGPGRDAPLDDALAARGFGPPSAVLGGEVQALYRPVRGLAFGPRLGLRHRHWAAWEGPPAALLSLDLMLAITARLPIGSRVWLGGDLAGGVGLGRLAIRDGRSTHVLGRFQVSGVFALELVGALRATVRAGYEWAPVDLPLGDGRLGGPFFLLGFEVRE